MKKVENRVTDRDMLDTVHRDTKLLVEPQNNNSEGIIKIISEHDTLRWGVKVRWIVIVVKVNGRQKRVRPKEVASALRPETTQNEREIEMWKGPRSARFALWREDLKLEAESHPLYIRGTCNRSQF